MSAKPSSELKNTSYEIFIGLLSILSILNLVLVYVFRADQSLQTILWIMNALLSGIFMIDFLYRFFTTTSKTDYFFRQYGWADLLASLPLEQLKILRLFRLYRVYRLMQDYGVKNIVRGMREDRANSALLTLLFAGILVLEFGSLSILSIEEYAPHGNIKTAADAIWYVIVTISTVGYGDFYPTTNAGRMVGALIIVIGVGIFGTFTGYLANLFLSPKKKEPAVPTGAGQPADMQVRLAQLKALSDQQQTAIEEIEQLLAEKA